MNSAALLGAGKGMIPPQMISMNIFNPAHSHSNSVYTNGRRELFIARICT